MIWPFFEIGSLPADDNVVPPGLVNFGLRILVRRGGSDFKFQKNTRQRIKLRRSDIIVKKLIEYSSINQAIANLNRSLLRRNDKVFGQ